MIKKFNAVISLLCSVCLLCHFGTMTYSMLTGWYNYNVCKTLAHLTAGFVGIHVILVMIIFFFLHDGSDLSRYRKENAKVIVQRISGLAMVALLHSHVKNYSFIMSGDPFLTEDKVRVIFLEVFFFCTVFLHLTTHTMIKSK